jgi:hypothetical protein
MTIFPFGLGCTESKHSTSAQAEVPIWENTTFVCLLRGLLENNIFILSAFEITFKV